MFFHFLAEFYLPVMTLRMAENLIKLSREVFLNTMYIIACVVQLFSTSFFCAQDRMSAQLFSAYLYVRLRPAQLFSAYLYVRLGPAQLFSAYLYVRLRPAQLFSAYLYVRLRPAQLFSAYLYVRLRPAQLFSAYLYVRLRPGLTWDLTFIAIYLTYLWVLS